MKCCWIVWLCSALAWAQPPQLGVLGVDAQGTWDPLTGQGDGRTFLRPKVVSRLSFEQRGHLLFRPERLLASDRAAEIIAPSRVLIYEPLLENRSVASCIDLQQGWRRRLVAPEGLEGEQARAQLAEWALQPEGPQAVAVVANRESGLYHRAEADHAITSAARVDLASNYLAEKQGFRPCQVCFSQYSQAPTRDDLEVQLGRVLAQQVESQFRLSQDPRFRERVERVGKRLLQGNLLEHDYRFFVLDSEAINAFAVPTGPLYITTGLLDVVESDDELAGILGHELAHSELHHGLRQYEQSQRLSWLALLATLATGNRWVYSAAQMFGTVLTRGYSREFELEADRQGLWYAYGAGYRADHFKFTLMKFQELERQRGGAGFSWLRTHPGNEQRLDEINAILVSLEPLGLLLEEIEPQDKGLADYLKRHAVEFLEKPQDTLQFYAAYRGLNLGAAP